MGEAGRAGGLSSIVGVLIPGLTSLPYPSRFGVLPSNTPGDILLLPRYPPTNDDTYRYRRERYSDSRMWKSRLAHFLSPFRCRLRPGADGRAAVAGYRRRWPVSPPGQRGPAGRRPLPRFLAP